MKGRRAPALAGLFGSAAVQSGVGLLLASRGAVALLLAAGIGGLSVVFLMPSAVAVLSFVLVLNSRRLGGPVDLSVADAAIVAAATGCFRLVPWRSEVVRRFVAACGLYLGILAIAVVATPTMRAHLEWLHRGSLLVGSFVVGVAVARQNQVRRALSAYVAACAVVAVAAMEASVSSGFSPAYPLGLHKNAAGAFLMTALLVTAGARSTLRWPRHVLTSGQVLLIGGLLACQSRGAAATFAVLYMVRFLRSGARSAAAFLGVVALTAMIWTTTQRLFDPAESSRFDSLQTRLSTYEYTIDLWRTDPIFGVGLRFWRDPIRVSGEPHNLIISALGESGVVGLGALVALHLGVVRLVRQEGGELAEVAVFAVVAHVIDSLAGIFWVAGTGTIPWMLVGVALGQAARAQPPPLPFTVRRASTDVAASAAQRP